METLTINLTPVQRLTNMKHDPNCTNHFSDGSKIFPNRDCCRALTDEERQQCLLALLDDVIKKDEERTPGEMKSALDWLTDPDIKPRTNEEHVIAWIEAIQNDAISSASVSHGRNARALKDEVEWLLFVTGQYPISGSVFTDRLNSILSLYPDEILKRYLKHD